VTPPKTVGGVTDIMRPGLRVVFCGINPGLESGRLAQHFARPGNRFWKALHGSGFTDRLLTPAEQWTLLDYGLGITNIVARPSRAASDITPAELRKGAAGLEERIAVARPAWLAVLGVQAYRHAFRRPRAMIGRQDERIAASGLWVLPNPSGLQARYQLPELISLFAELRRAAGIDQGSRVSPDQPARRD
jgi:TDG/mug DNA glycosylase family protein